jgi:hypothetical protein
MDLHTMRRAFLDGPLYREMGEFGQKGEARDTNAKPPLRAAIPPARIRDED